MVTREQIEELSAHIARTFHPEQIILFGSYAYGEPSETSDVDLLVIMPLMEHTRPSFGVDLLVRDSEQVRQRLAWNDYFLCDIIERGQVLYAASNPRMGQQSSV